MIRIAAVISNRLRKLFGDDVAEWPAARVDDAITDMAPANYRGVHLGQPAGRRGEHRK